MNMTDAARGRGIVERWCILAEQRLEYLTELFESGRWRRYFDEVAFLENIQEAKLAVQTWRDLFNREATADNRPIDLSWLGQRSSSPAPRMVSFTASEIRAVRAPAAIRPVSAALEASEFEVLELPVRDLPSVELQPLEVIDEGQPEPAPLVTAAGSELEPWRRALDPAILEQRYPLLRNEF